MTAKSATSRRERGERGMSTPLCSDVVKGGGEKGDVLIQQDTRLTV